MAKQEEEVIRRNPWLDKDYKQGLPLFTREPGLEIDDLPERLGLLDEVTVKSSIEATKFTELSDTPSDYGLDKQFPMSDGEGAISWAYPFWKPSGSSIYFRKRVAVGHSHPMVEFHVYKPQTKVQVRVGAKENPWVEWHSTDEANGFAAGIGDAANKLFKINYDSPIGTASQLFLCMDAGNTRTGWYTASPQVPYHIKESACASATYHPDAILAVESTTNAMIQVSAGTDAGIVFCDDDSNPPAGGIVYDHANEQMEFISATNELMWLSSAGILKTAGTYIHNDSGASSSFRADAHDADAYFECREDGTIKWTVGFDYSDSLKFKISEGVPGANSRFEITSGGAIQLPNANQVIQWTGSAGGSGGLQYTDAGSAVRYALLFPGSDVVALCNRAANGTVELRANTSTAGSGGEVTVVTIEDTDVMLADGIGFNLQEDMTFTGATAVNQIKFPDHLADALSFKEATNAYQTFITTNGSEAVQFHQDVGVGIAPTERLHVYRNNAGDYVKISVENADATASSASAYSSIQAVANGSVWALLSAYGTNYNNAVFAGFGKVAGYINGLIVAAYSGGVIKFVDGDSGVEWARFNNDRNFGFGQTTFGANAINVFAMTNATAPTSSPTDCTQIYSADVAGVAGKAGIHFRDEVGNITSVGNGQILDSSGAISFGDENLSTTGTLACGDVSMSTGHFGVGIAPAASIIFRTGGDTLTGVDQYGLFFDSMWSGTTSTTPVYSGGTIKASTAITTYTGVHIENIALGGGASIGTQRGLYIAAPTRGTTNWGIYLSGGNSFLGSLIALGGPEYGTNMTAGIAMETGTAPTSSPANNTQIYSADVAGVAGKAGLHIRDEVGNIVSIGSGGMIMTGTARVYDGMEIHAMEFKAPAAGFASQVNRGMGVAWEFADGNEESIHTQCRIPGKWVDTEDLTVILIWDSPAVSLDCDWEVRYLFRAADQDMTTAAPEGTTQAYKTSSGTTKGLVHSTFTIPTAAFDSGDKILKLDIHRDGNDGSDTLAASAFLHAIAVRGIADRMGGATS